MSFWKELKKPIIVLAPMADVTDPAFRRIIAKYGKPDVMWTEFVSADGLLLASEEGKRKLLKDLEYSEEERPIVAQFFTSNPAHMEKVSRLARELGFDGIDINMGCPDKSIEKQGAGASLIKNPRLARELIRSAKRGAGNIPVSVKTRIGYNKDELKTWLPELLAEEPVAITIHARTRKEMSKVPAQWEKVREAVKIRDEMGSETLIIGNGDAHNIDDARKKCAEFCADGVMLGRAIFGTPWLFSNLSQLRNDEENFKIGLSVKEKLLILVEHTNLFEELLGDVKNFAIMKKHFKAYLSGVALAKSDGTGFNGAGELRAKLMETENAKEVGGIINSWLESVDNS